MTSGGPPVSRRRFNPSGMKKKRSSRSNPPGYRVNSFVLLVSARRVSRSNAMFDGVQSPVHSGSTTNHVLVKTGGRFRKRPAAFIFALGIDGRVRPTIMRPALLQFRESIMGMKVREVLR